MARTPDAPAPMTADQFAESLAVSRETVDRFEAWFALLTSWNRRVNLVAASTLADFWRRHALDGAQVADLAPREARLWVDMGAGAGVPGLAVALIRAGRGWDTEMVLVEPVQKKAAFLREAIRATGAPARVEARRIEEVSGVTADIVTSRALAPLAQLLDFAGGVWGPNTVGLFPKGREAESEVRDAMSVANAHGLQIQLSASRSSVDSWIAQVVPASADR